VSSRPDRPLRIGITCYPSVGGSGILAASLGEQLARRGHAIHFISYERPFRISADADRTQFHPVVINDYALFKYPDYTLPLSVKMAEVAASEALDVLHVHYAVPHATAAILARSMLPPDRQPRVVTTLHGTDTTLLGRDAGYRPAIRHALGCSDAVTVVSHWLKQETHRLLDFPGPIDVIHNFYAPRPPSRSVAEVRAELGLRDELLLVHLSNLRPVKRVDLLLDAIARVRPRERLKLLIIAGEDFGPFVPQVERLGLTDRVIVRHRVAEVEDYLQAADLGVFTSENESFCLGVLEAMSFGRPSVATNIGGVPEVVEPGVSGVLVAAGDVDAFAREVELLLADTKRRTALGRAAQARAQACFSVDAIVPQYEALYRRVIG